MGDDVVAGDVEVEVDFGAAGVGVGGHGVPDGAVGEVGEAHDELAGFDAALVDVLVDFADVGGGLGAEGAGGGLVFGDVGGGVGGVGGGGDDVEFGAFAGEGDVFGTHRDIEAVEIGEGEGFAVDGDDAGGADVDDAGFAALEEEVGAGLFDVIEFERGPPCRLDAEDGHAVEVGEGHGDLAGEENSLDQEVGTQFVSWQR